MFTSSQKNTAFRSINAYENRYEMQICILRPEKARFSHPVIARNRCREHAQHAPLMKGRSSGSGIIIVSRLPGFPVAYLIRLLRYSGGTARALHPFPYYPAENFTGTSCVILLYCTRKRLRLSNTFNAVGSHFQTACFLLPAQQPFQFLCIFCI